MNRLKTYAIFFALLLFGYGGKRLSGQTHASQSVLAQHTWYKIAVDKEGVYKLDYAAFESMGIDMAILKPNQIRLFGNESGSLPEANAATRPDDLTEMALYVEGESDGTFDEEDFMLFYAQEPTRWTNKTNNLRVYERERNYYTDSTYYFLCVDSGANGIRIAHQASQSLDEADVIITEFPDFAWHETELFSPFNIGRNWFGEMLSGQDSLLNIKFHLPNLVKEKTVYIKTKIMARSLTSATRYDLWVNDNAVMNNGVINAVSSSGYHYGNSVTLDRQMTIGSDTLDFNLRLLSTTAGNIMMLDYVELFFWRQLKRVGRQFPFRLSPTQLTQNVAAVWIQDANSDCILWDVSQPLRPCVQEGVLSAGNYVFAISEASERRYLMFEPASAMPIGSWRAVANQNLHAITEADALIFTAPLFRQHAEDLADFHRQNDGLTLLVVDVNEVYNEFSAGIADPTAIRDFIRMVYARSQHRLQYVIMFGRPSFDYRNLGGFNANFVPCYEEKYDTEHLVDQMGTDDYFGLMDEDEGANCVGKVDLGIGRLPVSKPAEAENVVRKIKHYHDMAAMHGEWKTNFLLLTGDDSNGYMMHSEEIGTAIDTSAHAINPLKIYTMGYPKEQTPAGPRIPKAHDDLISAFNKGFIGLSYSGHGGVKGLTSVGVFSISDMPLLKNKDRLPFLFTATCEYAKYDDPSFVSAGELLFLMPEGGAGALLTSCRPTIAQNNANLGRSLMRAMFKRDADGKPKRFGDIMKAAKSDDAVFAATTSNNPTASKSLCYFFMGDPLLRFPMPEGHIATVKINGKNPHTTQTNLHGMSMVNIEGEVRKHDGSLDADFNGKLWLRFFDKKTTAYISANGTTHYTHYRDVIHTGYASVRNGRFTASMQIPSDIHPDDGTPRLNYYAYDSIRQIEAMGAFEHMTLGGTDPAVAPDNEGPQISFYWNTPDFVNGEQSERHGVLYADLYDAQGIYHYDFGLGRDIVLGSNVSAFNNTVLNDVFEPAIDDFRRGRIAFPIENLKPGQYEFSLRAWDTQNNATTARLWFVVADDVFLSGVGNYPNPFSGETNITIKHSGDDGVFDLSLQVFDVMGRHVATVEDRLESHKGDIGPLRWDGKDTFGNNLPTGLYLYRLTLSDEQGHSHRYQCNF